MRFAMEWRRCALGHDVVTDRGGAVLIAPRSDDERDFTGYDPFAETALFKRLVAVQGRAGAALDPSAVCAFADRFGVLGLRATAPATVARDGHPTNAEPLWAWRREIEQLRRAMRAPAAACAGFNHMGPRALAIRLVIGGRPARPDLQLRPQTLADALWLQLAHSVAFRGATEGRLCAHCGTEFEVGGETGLRRSRIYCSKRCQDGAGNLRRSKGE